MAEVDSWPSIRHHGLLSTSALLELFEMTGAERLGLLATFGTTSRRILGSGGVGGARAAVAAISRDTRRVSVVAVGGIDDRDGRRAGLSGRRALAAGRCRPVGSVGPGRGWVDGWVAMDAGAEERRRRR
jgi:hypothetical protein